MLGSSWLLKGILRHVNIIYPPKVNLRGGGTHLGRYARAAHEGRREKSEAFLKLRLAFECERIPRSTEDEQCVFMCMRKNVAEYAMGVSILPAALHSQRNAGPPHTP